MRLVLQPAEDAAHDAWLRQTQGAYEWWYFDALSDDGVWALAVIWFLGNPFSPYYRLAAVGRSPDPYKHNALFCALYREGRLYAYHFTRFPTSQVSADPLQPATLCFGPNTLDWDGCRYALHVNDENANRRTLTADLQFIAPPLVPATLPADNAGDHSHAWLPAAPACRVSGTITLREAANPGRERIQFGGHGYHDHNWGALPFDQTIQDWYWARLSLGPEEALLLYHVRYRGGRAPVSHLLHFVEGQLIFHDRSADVRFGRGRRNGFGLPYATDVTVRSVHLEAALRLQARLDSAPFYVRTVCSATVRHSGRVREVKGMAEYFRPHGLAGRVTSSAMKARLVDLSLGGNRADALPD